MKVYLTLFFLLLSKLIIGQTLEETLDYINDGMKNYPAYSPDFSTDARRSRILISEQTKSLSEEIHFTSYYDTWEINSKGKLTIKGIKATYFIPIGTTYPLWQTIEPQNRTEVIEIREVYLKSLMPNYIEINDGKYGETYSYTTLVLSCKGVNDCIVSKLPIKEKGSYTMSFSIKGKENAKKISNAVKHLLELANNRSEFLEKDPFSDR